MVGNISVFVCASMELVEIKIGSSLNLRCYPPKFNLWQSHFLERLRAKISFEIGIDKHIRARMCTRTHHFALRKSIFLKYRSISHWHVSEKDCYQAKVKPEIKSFRNGKQSHKYLQLSVEQSQNIYKHFFLLWWHPLKGWVLHNPVLNGSVTEFQLLLVAF